MNHQIQMIHQMTTTKKRNNKAMTNYENLSGLDKAAIIFQVYGESLALSFFTDLLIFSGNGPELPMQVVPTYTTKLNPRSSKYEFNQAFDK